VDALWNKLKKLWWVIPILIFAYFFIPNEEKQAQVKPVKIRKKKLRQPTPNKEEVVVERPVVKRVLKDRDRREVHQKAYSELKLGSNLDQMEFMRLVFEYLGPEQPFRELGPNYTCPEGFVRDESIVEMNGNEIHRCHNYEGYSNKESMKWEEYQYVNTRLSHYIVRLGDQPVFQMHLTEEGLLHYLVLLAPFTGDICAEFFFQETALKFFDDFNANDGKFDKLKKSKQWTSPSGKEKSWPQEYTHWAGSIGGLIHTLQGEHDDQRAQKAMYYIRRSGCFE
jgi:hypothetical protein